MFKKALGMVFARLKVVYKSLSIYKFSIPQQNRHDDLAVSSLTRRHTCEALYLMITLETNTKNKPNHEVHHDGYYCNHHNI
jgi:hypothetical protein